MKNKIYILGLIVLAPFLNACDSSKSASEVLNICIKKWAVLSATGKTYAKINNGALVITADSLKSSTPISVNQANVSGDFEAIATFEGFNPGVSTAFFQMMTTPVSSVNIALANVTTGTVVASTVTPLANDTKTFLNASQTPLSGTFKIKRVGANVTITSTVNYATGSETATQSGLYTDANLTIGFQLGTLNDVKDISVKVTDFKITGGGALVGSDSFDCNSIIN